MREVGHGIAMRVQLLKGEGRKRDSTCIDLRSGKGHYSVKCGDERFNMLREVRGADET